MTFRTRTLLAPYLNSEQLDQVHAYQLHESAPLRFISAALMLFPEEFPKAFDAGKILEQALGGMRVVTVLNEKFDIDLVRLFPVHWMRAKGVIPVGWSSGRLRLIVREPESLSSLVGDLRRLINEPLELSKIECVCGLDTKIREMILILARERFEHLKRPILFQPSDSLQDLPPATSWEDLQRQHTRIREQVVREGITVYSKRISEDISGQLQSLTSQDEAISLLEGEARRHRTIPPIPPVVYFAERLLGIVRHKAAQDASYPHSLDAYVNLLRLGYDFRLEKVEEMLFYRLPVHQTILVYGVSSILERALWRWREGLKILWVPPTFDTAYRPQLPAPHEKDVEFVSLEELQGALEANGPIRRFFYGLHCITPGGSVVLRGTREVMQHLDDWGYRPEHCGIGGPYKRWQTGIFTRDDLQKLFKADPLFEFLPHKRNII